MNKSLLPVVVVPSAVLLIPLSAMLLKAEGWLWTASDFVFMWVLVASVMLTYQLVTRKAVSRSYRFGTALGLLTGFLLIWINGAVGFIGSEDNPANLMYAGVLAVGAVGAALARFEPRGMARALVATAVAQALVPVLALLFWPADFSPGVATVFGLNACFVALFAGAAWLFRQAARG